jgi:cell division septal protein FtsQ
MKNIKPQRIYKADHSHDSKKRVGVANLKEEKQARERLVRCLHFLLCVLFFGVVVYVFLFSSFVKIQKVDVVGLDELSRTEVESVVSESYSGKYLGIFPKNGFFLFPSKKMEDILRDRFRKIRNIDIRRTFPNGVSVEIVERKSLLVWCSGGPCYLIDENGLAYMGADFSSPDIAQNHLIKIVDTSAKPVALGANLFSKEFIDFLLRAVVELPQKSGIELGEECSTPSRLAGEMSFYSPEGVRISLSTELPLDQTMKNLEIFMRKQLSEDERKNIEYLDLRFENRVFYKIKGQEEENKDQSGSDEMVAGDETVKADADDGSERKKENKKKN